jgi:integrase/recombinase XerD
MEILNNLEKYRKEMKIINYSERTISCYISVVNTFLQAHGNFKEPKAISDDVIKKYLAKCKSTTQIKQNIGAIKLFYKLVIHQPLKFKYIHYPRREKRLPVIWTAAEIQQLINQVTNLKHRAIICTLYSTGMRRSELINLKNTDILSSQMLIKINQGKGKKDRYVPLDPQLLAVLRQYYKIYRPVNWLFTSQDNTGQYSSSSILQLLKKYATAAGIKKRIYPHLLRHSCFTHMIESGTDISIVKEVAGHASTRTTEIYKHLGHAFLSNLATPLNSINLAI